MLCDPVEMNLHVLRTRMFRDVCEDLLNDAIHRSFNLLGIPFSQGGMDSDRHTRSRRNTFSKKFQRWNKSQVVQNRGAELEGKPAQLLLHLIENHTDFLKTSLERGVDILRHPGHRQARGKKQLSGLVMDGVGDALDFLFQCFIEPTQGRSGVLESAMSNLVRRKALGEEFLCPVQIMRKRYRRAHALQHPHNSSVMHVSHIEHTPPMRQSSASDFVRASQSVFTAHREIFLESTGVRPLEIAHVIVLNARTHAKPVSIVQPAQEHRRLSCRAVPESFQRPSVARSLGPIRGQSYCRSHRWRRGAYLLRIRGELEHRVRATEGLPRRRATTTTLLPQRA